MTAGALRLTTVVVAVLSFLITQPPSSLATPALVESTFVHVPSTARRNEPLQVVVAVHGLGGNGETFGSQLIEHANSNNWVIVAPTLHYGNWWNVEELVHEDTAFAQWLMSFVDNLQREAGVIPRERLLLFGFSRGAGVIDRFAILHPDRVAAAAALSSGAYTLPATHDEEGQKLAFPFGIADLAAHAGQPFNARAFAATRWFVGVGESDNVAQEVPQAWTPSSGPTRVDRAQRFSATLHSTGAEVTLRIFPKAGHFLTPEMRTEALGFLQDADGSSQTRAVPATTPVVAHVRSVTPTVSGTGSSGVVPTRTAMPTETDHALQTATGTLVVAVRQTSTPPPIPPSSGQNAAGSEAPPAMAPPVDDVPLPPVADAATPRPADAAAPPPAGEPSTELVD